MWKKRSPQRLFIQAWKQVANRKQNKTILNNNCKIINNNGIVKKIIWQCFQLEKIEQDKNLDFRTTKIYCCEDYSGGKEIKLIDVISS